MERREYEHTVTLKFTGEAFEDVLFALMINRALQEADASLRNSMVRSKFFMKSHSKKMS